VAPAVNAFAKGSQTYRDLQTKKRRERQAKQAQVKREAQLKILKEASKIATAIFNGERFSTTRLNNIPPSLIWRHFHRWVMSFSGIQRENQGFTKFDDADSVTLRRRTDPRSEDFQKIQGKVFKLCVPHKKSVRIFQWRSKHLWPSTIPLKGHFSRPLTRHYISRFGLYFQQNKEASKLRLRPCVVGLCSSRVHRSESPNRREIKKLWLNDPSLFLARAATQEARAAIRNIRLEIAHCAH
jgi:hypothetical protein